MTIDERTQADMLDQFLLNPAAKPPTGLDAGVAATATLLSQRLTPSGPTPEFVRKLEQQLTTTPANNQTGPATITDWKPRSRRSELLRIAAAGLVILLLGSLLIYLFSSQDDRPQVASPGGFTDGEILVSWDPAGNESYKLFVVPVDGRPHKLTPGPYEDDGVVEINGVWSPDGRWVAYIRDDGETSAVYITPLDRYAQPINITPSIEASAVYGWSPNGSEVLFGGRGEQGASIFVMNADGTNIRVLTDRTEGSVYGAWSPDGQQIAFAGMGPKVSTPSGASSYFELWMMDVDGSNPRPITELEAIVGAPVWNPDGHWVAFWFGSDIWTVDPNGENLTNLTNTVLAYDEPAWAHDQNRIVYATGNHAVGSEDIAVIDMDGTVIEQWTPDADVFRTPAWSPDDQYFAYLAGDRIDPDSTAESRDLTYDDYTWRLEITTVDGSQRQVLLEGSINRTGRPSWNPAGRSTPLEDEPLSPSTERAGWPNAARIWQGAVSQEVVHTSGACGWFDYPVCNEESIWMIPAEPMEMSPTEPVAFRVDGLDDADVEIVSIQAIPISTDSVLTTVDDEMVLLDPARGEVADGMVLPIDGITFLPNLPPGDYVIGVEVRHTPTEGTAYYGFHIRIGGEPVVDVTSTPESFPPTGPEPTPDGEPSRTFDTPYDDAEVLHVVSVMVNVNGQEFETHTWVNQTNGDTIVQRYMDGTLWETLLRRGRTLISFNQDSISQYEYLSESDPALELVTGELFTFRDDLREGNAVALAEEEYMGQPALKVTRTDVDPGSGEPQMVWLDPETLFPLGSGPDSPISFSYPVVEALPVGAMPNEMFDMDPPDTSVHDFYLRQFTIDEVQQFDLFSVWWPGEEWNGYRLQRIEYTTTTLVEESEVMHLVYVDAETGEQVIVLSAHGELREWQIEDWENAPGLAESIEIGEFSGWLYESPPNGLVVFHIGDGTHYLKIDAPSRAIAIEAVEALEQMNGQ